METEGTSPRDAAGSPAGARAAGRAVTDGYVAAPVPLLVVVSLAGGHVVDATTVSYLLQVELQQKEEEEERKVRRGRSVSCDGSRLSGTGWRRRNASARRRGRGRRG